jgi:hypothetical protein
MRLPSLFLSLPILASLALASVGAQAGAPDVDAVWERHEIEFTYMGFTTRYSCEGLQGKVRLLLAASGARPDFEVTTLSCAAGAGSVTEFPRVRIVFYAAGVPADGSQAAADATPAQWQAVSLRRNQPRDLEMGDCELVEQFRDRVLVAFTTRNVSSEINCIPHQLAGSAFRLDYDVLVGSPQAGSPRPRR